MSLNPTCPYLIANDGAVLVLADLDYEALERAVEHNTGLIWCRHGRTCKVSAPRLRNAWDHFQALRNLHQYDPSVSVRLAQIHWSEIENPLLPD